MLISVGLILGWRNSEHEGIQQLNAEVTTRTKMQKERDRDKYKNEKKEFKKTSKRRHWRECVQSATKDQHDTDKAIISFPQ